MSAAPRYPSGVDARTVLSVFVGGVLVIVGLLVAVIVQAALNLNGLADLAVIGVVLLVEAGVAVLAIRSRRPAA